MSRRPWNINAVDAWKAAGGDWLLALAVAADLYPRTVEGSRLIPVARRWALSKCELVAA